MSLSLATVWEVRPTVGNDSNGGGFVAGASGTDFSQQDSPNSGGNNQSTTDGVGNGTTTWTSATASFTAAIVGNIIHLSGTGITTGFYQVTAFTNSTTVTIDRSPGTGTGATMNIGGALATISAAYAAATLQNTIYVKATGTYTFTTTLTLTGQNLLPFSFIGYTTTRTDGGKVTWTTSTNSTPHLTAGGSDPINFVFRNFTFTSTASTKSQVMHGGVSSQLMYIRFVNCVIDGVKSASTGYEGGVSFNIENMAFDSCEIKNCTSHGIATSPGISIVACIIHDNTGDGIHLTRIGSGINGGLSHVHLERTVIYNNGAIGIDAAEIFDFNGEPLSVLLSNCAILNNVGDGIFFRAQTGTDTFQNCFLMNCIIDSNGGFGVNNAANSFAIFRDYNTAWRSNTSGDVNGAGVVKGSGDITLTADPFTNRSSLDFSLNNTAGGGAACKAAGFPATLGA